jgi:hypothetical protein
MSGTSFSMPNTPDPVPSPESCASRVVYVYQTDARSRPAREEANKALAARIEAVIEQSLRGRIYDLHVICSDDSIVLRGRARTQYHKQLAQEAVRCRPNEAFSLINEITVGQPK